MKSRRTSKTSISGWASNERIVACLFLAPGFSGFLVFTLVPILASFGISLVDWDILSPPRFVGASNFVDLLGFHRNDGGLVPNDPLFWKYLYNTVFMMLSIPLCMGGSLLVALVLNRKIRGVTAFRTIYFLPTVCSGVALCLLWKWVLNSEYGIVNILLAKACGVLHLGLQPPDWLSDRGWAKPALMLMGFWGALGGTSMLMYLAALQNVPRDLYEAAEIDGANAWHKLRAVTLPFLSPTSFFILIMNIIGGFQGGFMAAYLMTGGGPDGATTTIEYYVYTNAYVLFKTGYAAAVAWVLFLLVLVATLFNWRYGGKLVHYN